MSKALATKNVAAILLTVVMVFGIAFSFATPAKADVISDLQAQIAALLAQITAFQAQNGITPTAGYWGPLTRAKANALCAGVTPGVPVVPGTPITGNGLKVALAADNPTY